MDAGFEQMCTAEYEIHRRQPFAVELANAIIGYKGYATFQCMYGKVATATMMGRLTGSDADYFTSLVCCNDSPAFRKDVDYFYSLIDGMFDERQMGYIDTYFGRNDAEPA